MKFEIKATEDFRKSLKALSKRHRSLKHDFEEFTKSLLENPFQGDELCPGLRKIRMAISSKGRGKSGGARVITYTLVETDNEGWIYLLDIYDKSDYSTVDIAVLQKIINWLGIDVNT